MENISDKPWKPGTAQDSRAPQDESPASGSEKKKDPQSAPGKSPRNEKQKPVERKKKKKKNELLSDNADIHDETTI